MKRLQLMLSACMLSLCAMVAAFSPALAAEEAATPTEQATRLLDHLDAGDYAAAEAMFSAEMASAVPADKLQAVWQSLPTQAGAAQGRGTPVVQSQAGTTLVEVPLHHVNAALIARVAINEGGEVVGFLIQPAPPAAAAAPPDNASYMENDFLVGEGARALPGTLALPKADAPTAGRPAVVLVHGSGPHDRDQTIGPNRPFLDLARGLATRDIAVLRYDKRTRARPQDYADGPLSIDSETTDDAVAAVAALRSTPGIDPDRVFVLGHSQGAMMAPRIAARANAAGAPLAGLILLAAPARPLLDILIEQNRRMAVLDDGRTSPREAAAIDQLRAQVRAVRAGGSAGAEDLPAAQLPMGLPAAYWRSIDAVDPVAEAQAVALPMLLLQGARDIQVVDADWQAWRGGFHDDPKVTFKLYDALSHLGIAGEGPGSLADYTTPGQVDGTLIDDIAAWIRQH
ncbi:MAG: alpha/beta fold hydrolase [Pseudomonadota bacterium]|nr:alpha/beta fold hydrolase [Pseudomonadota bacterium]